MKEQDPTPTSQKKPNRLRRLIARAAARTAVSALVLVGASSSAAKSPTRPSKSSTAIERVVASTKHSTSTLPVVLAHIPELRLPARDIQRGCNSQPKHLSPAQLAAKEAVRRAFLNNKPQSFAPNGRIWSPETSSFVVCLTQSPIEQSGYLFRAKQTGHNKNKRTVRFIPLPERTIPINDPGMLIQSVNPVKLPVFGEITTRRDVFYLNGKNQLTAKASVYNPETGVTQKDIPVPVGQTQDINFGSAGRTASNNSATRPDLLPH